LDVAGLWRNHLLNLPMKSQREKYLSRIVKGQTMSMDLTEPDAGSDLQAVMLKANL